MTRREALQIVRALLIVRAEFMSKYLGASAVFNFSNPSDEEWEAIAKLAGVEL